MAKHNSKSSSRSQNRSFVIGVAGGSGSGKTTLVDSFCAAFSVKTTVISQDLYYRDLRNMSLEGRIKVNFDHPDSLEIDLMASHINELAEGRAINAPVYDFHNHTRNGQQRISPGKIIIVEGTLALAIEPVCSCFDYSVFIDAPADIRLLRRIERDLQDRGRTLDDVKWQYFHTVRPMYEKYIAPSKNRADLIIDGALPLDALTKQFVSEVKKLIYQVS
jgi:uridine kinase